MTRVLIALSRIRGLLHRDRLERDLCDEVEFHLAMAEQDARRAGLSAQDARVAALRHFGGVDQVKESYRDTRGLPALETFGQDLRHAFRNWRRTPGVWATAVVALALGVGANATIFSTVRAIVVRPLAVFDQERTFWVGAASTRSGVQRERLCEKEFVALSERNRYFDALAAVQVVGRVMRGTAEPEQVAVARVSPSFFTLAHAAPVLGRYPTPEDARPSASHVVVLSHATWKERFGGRADILGRSIRLDDATYSIIGVSPDDLWFPTRRIRAWIPLVLRRTDERAFDRTLAVFGTLRPGASLNDAQRDCDAVVAAVRAQDASRYGDWVLRARTLYDGVFQPNDRVAIALLYVLAAGVLVVACANVANLLLAKALARRREQAIRLSMGATRGRLLRQSLAEALLLAIPAGVLGLALAMWSAQLLVHSFNTDVKLPEQIVDWNVVLFTGLVALGSLSLFAAAPALLAGRFDLSGSLKEGGSRTGRSRASHWMRRTFVVAQTCLALALLGTAVMTAKGVYRMHSLNIGYEPRGLFYVRLDPSSTEYSTDLAARSHLRRAIAAVAAAPGVKHASALDLLPHVEGNGRPTNFLLEGQPEPRPEDRRAGTFVVAAPGAIETLGVPVIAGRLLNDHDDTDAPAVVAINRTAAANLWPGANPLGRRVRLDALGKRWFTVIGVLGDVRRDDITQPVRPQFYVPWDQSFSRSMVVVVRTDGSDRSTEAVRAAIRGIEPDDPITVRSAEWELRNDLTGSRVVTAIFTVFAALAVFLAAIGLFSVVTQNGRERMQEVGVRLALGATPSSIVRLLMTESTRLTAIGVAIGWLVLAGIGMALGPMLLQPAVDPVTFVVAGLLLYAVASAATALPARAGAHVDPAHILRAD